MTRFLSGMLYGFLLLASYGTAQAEVREIDNQALLEMQFGSAKIIDVRRLDEWKSTGMLQGSHGITFFDERGNYDVNGWLAALAELTGPDEPIVLICARGIRSSKIAQLLDTHYGFSAVHNVTDGIHAWLRSGHPVVPYTP
ncbi:MAG: rhodanese-like domain-containing protein [Granulosicoccus sp.]|nr:rhodanese-like domain-containing protein [Granulosicoccus sp.]